MLNESNEIKQLYKRIKANDAAIRLANSFSIVNGMLGYHKHIDTKQTKQLELGTTLLLKKINEVQTSKKQRPKEFRKTGLYKNIGRELME